MDRIRVATSFSTLAFALPLALVLAPGAPARALTPSAPVSDEELTHRVEERLDRDPRLRTFDLDVDVRQGTVVLRGTVPTLADALEAREVAFDVPGVGQLDSRIELSTRGRPDKDVEFDILNRFRNNADLAAARLTVEVRDGAVLLSGTVDDPRLRYVARAAAASVPGVIGVADELAVPELGDADLLANVNEILGRADDDPAASHVTARVRQGVVVLEGRVPTSEQRRAAVARVLGLRGVRGVVNRVTVEGP